MHLPWAVAALIVLTSAAGGASSVSPPSVRVLVPDGAWTWYNDERVIVVGQVLCIASMDSQGRADVHLFRLSPHAGVAAGEEYVLSSWKSRDDHNGPALIRLDNGKILAAYAKHDLEPKWYWRLADFNNRSQQLTWTPEQVFTQNAKSTYSNLFQLSGEHNRIYNFIRAINFNPTLLYSDDEAQSWIGPFQLIKTGTGSTRPYVKLAGNGKDRIDLLYTDGHPRDVPRNNVYHLYYSNGGFHKSDGTLIRTLEEVKTNPLVPADGTRVYDGSSATGRGWVWDLEYDGDGSPVAAYISSPDGADGNDLRYRYARWDSRRKTWIDGQIAYAGTHLYVPENHYAGGISIDPADANTVYISANVDPVTGRRNATGHYQIFRGTKQGSADWLWTPLTANTDVDNLRPIVPRNHGCKTCVIWLQGSYRSYTDYGTRIVGIIE
jgi:hypothetical protein